MLIGTSLGKCVKDILDGKVKEEDVFFIASNTRCPDLTRLMDVIETYHGDPSYVHGGAYDMKAHSLEDTKALAQRLYENGQLHQPRCFMKNWTGSAHYLQNTWYEIVPTPSTHNQSVLDAYGQYRMLADLAK